jgi:diguanylate cyclase (GGDEF)-like protein
MEENLLWRWSLIGQISSGVALALFFWALARTGDPGRHTVDSAVALNAGSPLSAWKYAWFGNLLALAAANAFWWGVLDAPPGSVNFLLLSLAYALGKSAFVYMVLVGVAVTADRGLGPKHGLPLLVGVALAVPLLGRDLNSLGVVQSVVTCIGLAIASFWAWQSFARPIKGPDGELSPRFGDWSAIWLTIGCGLRSMFALVEGLAYWRDSLGEVHPIVAAFLGAQSTFDAAAEWLIALGMVVVVHARTNRALQDSIQELHLVQVRLTLTSSTDSLTGLLNRRGLEQVATAQGALALFDLNEFKKLNDREGHLQGDKALQVFANELQRTWPHALALARWAGDEFVVLEHRYDPEVFAKRLAEFRKHLASAEPPIACSCGYVENTGFAAALAAADNAMYADKRRPLPQTRAP